MTHWQPYTEEKNRFFENLPVAKDEVVSYEKETAKQTTRNKWKYLLEKNNNMK